MSDLIVVAYPDTHTASEVLVSLQRLQTAYLIDLEDACVVTRDTDGKMRLHQAFDLTTEGVIRGGYWGALIGLLFLNPLLGIAVGMGAGGVGGMLSDYGINDKFIKELGAKLEPGTSAIFLLIRKVTTDKVLDSVAAFGGHILQSSLTTEQDARLRAALQHELPSRFALSPAAHDMDRVLTQSDADLFTGAV